jgi:hypothetical protein
MADRIQESASGPKKKPAVCVDCGLLELPGTIARLMPDFTLEETV